jgi:Mg2+-importing ATPase
LGNEIDDLDDEKLREAVEEAHAFCRLTPMQKQRIIKALKQNGHDVGFMGDGVNDVPALHEADVAISVNDAVDVAKESSDIILLRKSLNVLADGVVEGRKIFGNTMKYIMMGTSSNFGNMFSAAGASLFLPFLPMLPIQILLVNLLYDVSESTIPTDNVDKEYIKKPKRLNIGAIKRYMLFFGPISSIYDFFTYFVMIFVFSASMALFQTGWFIESMITQVFVVFVIRTRKIPFFKSKPGKALLASSIIIALVTILIPFTGLGKIFGFTAPPLLYFGILILMVVTYLVLVEIGKYWFFKKYEI